MCRLRTGAGLIVMGTEQADDIKKIMKEAQELSEK